MPPKAKPTATGAKKAPAKSPTKAPVKKATAKTETSGTGAATKTPVETPKAEAKPAGVKQKEPISVSVKAIKDILVSDNRRQIRDKETCDKVAALVNDNDDGIAGRFLVYSGATMLEALKVIKKTGSKELDDAEVERLRVAVLGSLRQGKPLILDIDAGDYDVFESLSQRFDEVEPGLMNKLLDRSVMKDCWYEKLIREQDGDTYKSFNFIEETMDQFFVVVVTKNKTSSTELCDKFTVFNIE